MPQGRPNSYAGGGFIKSMREKHEPHMKLAGRVEGLEKSIPIALAGIHKTSSKSFGLQRKTLMRVIALEKKVSGITIIIDGLEDAAADAVKKPSISLNCEEFIDSRNSFSSFFVQSSVAQTSSAL